MKEKYEVLEMEITEFDIEDVITTSGKGGSNDDLSGTGGSNDWINN